MTTQRVVLIPGDGIEHYIDPSRSAAETIGIVTRSGSDRIIRHAYEYARKHNRKKVTTVPKANILKYTGGLFLEVARELAQEGSCFATFGKRRRPTG